MKKTLLTAAVVALSISSAATAMEPSAPVYKVQEILGTILPNVHNLYTVQGKGTVDGGAEQECLLMFSPHESYDSFDIYLIIQGDVKTKLTLKNEVSNFYEAYESELTVTYDLKQPHHLGIFTSRGHMTDQYRGYEGDNWVFHKNADNSFTVSDAFDWADDDGGYGGTTYSCKFEQPQP